MKIFGCAFAGRPMPMSPAQLRGPLRAFVCLSTLSLVGLASTSCRSKASPAPAASARASSVPLATAPGPSAPAQSTPSAAPTPSAEDAAAQPLEPASVRFECDGAWVLRDGSVDCISEALDVVRSIPLPPLPMPVERPTLRLLRLRTGQLMIYAEGDHWTGKETLGFARRYLLDERGNITSQRDLDNPWLGTAPCGKGTCQVLVERDPDPTPKQWPSPRLLDYSAQGWWQAYVGAKDGLCVELFNRNLNAAEEGQRIYLPLLQGKPKGEDLFVKDSADLVECRGHKVSNAKDAFEIESFDHLRTSPDGKFSIYGAEPLAPGDYAHAAYFAYDEEHKTLFAIRDFSLSRAWKKEEVAPFLKRWLTEKLIGERDPEHPEDPSTTGVEDSPHFAGPRGHLIDVGNQVFSPTVPGKSLQGIALPGSCPFDRTLCK